ncbi:MAG TPA: dTDP-glucose 4,6-dehydratase [Burkholderiaceae bacterium]|nr:dTDP-glucose 4,6-dehydratase [Burkholderiaceae bacterium]
MIFITGGAGFIGSNFVIDWLGQTDEKVLVIDKLTYAGNLDNLASVNADARLSFERVDICDGESIAALLRVHRPRALLHFAAESHVDRSIHGPADFVHTNVNGTYTVLEAVRAHWQTLGEAERAAFRFIHVSTDEVFGSLEPNDPPFTEQSPYAPNSPYSATKAASDHLVRAYHQTYALPTITTCCSNNYGPYQFPEKLIPLMILNAIEDRPLPVYGDGLNERDWLFVADHCAAIRAVLERGQVGNVYHIGSRNCVTNLDVVRSICRLLDELRPRVAGSHAEGISFVRDRPGHDRRYAIDPRKIERDLGWRARESFDIGLRGTVQWYLDHADWVQRVRSGEYRVWMERQYGSNPAHPIH